MDSSDDEGEMVPRSAIEYEFISDESGAISFGELPLQWNRDRIGDGTDHKIILRGKSGDGLLSLYTEVEAWKFDLSCQIPDISVLSVDGHWIKLLKPRKAFEVIIRTILITVHCLHFLKRNPEASRKNLWDHLAKRFSFDSKPSEDDLVDHVLLIREVVKRDETLEKSMILSAFLKEKPKKRRSFNEDTGTKFIVDDESESEDQKSDNASETEEVDENDCFDSVCAICDNGGHIYLCEGKCMRSFHATEEDGQESDCYSLRFSEEEVEALENTDFYCKNCEYKQHQCYSCGELGSSDESSGAEVFKCINGACGHFFHPSCVAKLLHPKDKSAAEEHCRKIAAGEQFTCPVHKCCVCNELEVRSDHELQFAICRRCPRAFHRKCLPREIAFDEDVDEESDTIPRAWDKLIPNRILIYCLDHVIDERFWTPLRNHIKFPGPQKKKSKLQIETSEMPFIEEDTPGMGSNAQLSKVPQKVSSESRKGDVSRKIQHKLLAPGLLQKGRVDFNRKSLGNSNKSRNVEGKISLKDKSYAEFLGQDSELGKGSREQRVRSEHAITQKTQNRIPSPKRADNTSSLDDDAKKRILTLMKDASSSITLEDVKTRYKAPSTHAYSLKHAVENVTLGKVQGSVQALRTALEKLEKGGSIQDAKAVCGNDLLLQVMKWKDKLKVYLAPFLYGMRYTSFGRHFTKMDKLQEIVDMLHYYIQDDDMVVDFCCGSNDFSVLLKKKLDEVGKTCSFKNYDIVEAKDNFCFERKDWMEVKPDDLPEGSRLIMGLNPPFGVNAALANKFINKALEFKPKLLILIVPRETQRLDKKRSRYNLIWEDDQMLAGKAFYLPGSVDVNEKQIEDWNVNAPVLYLWSSPDWTSTHKAIAEQQGHPGSRRNCILEENHMFQVSNKSQELQSVDKLQNQIKDEHPNEQVNQQGHPGSQRNCKLEENQMLQVSNKSEELKSIDELQNQVKDEHPSEQVNQNKESVEIRRQQEGLPRDSEAKNKQVQSSYHSELTVKDSGGKRKKKRKRASDKKALEDISATKRPAPAQDISATKRPAPKQDISATKRPAPIQDIAATKRPAPTQDKPATKRPAPTHSTIISSPGPHPSSHFPKQSPHVHSGRERSASLHNSPRRAEEAHALRYNPERESSRVPPVDQNRGFQAHPTYSQSGHDDMDLVMRYTSLGNESFPTASSRYTHSPYADYTEGAHSMYPESPIPDYSHRASSDRFIGYQDRMVAALPGPNSWGPRSSEYLSYPRGEMTRPVAPSSAMQRYAPRLDGISHVRPELDAAHPYHPPVFQPGPSGFTPGPYRPYGGSSGWLND